MRYLKEKKGKNKLISNSLILNDKKKEVKSS